MGPLPRGLGAERDHPGAPRPIAETGEKVGRAGRRERRVEEEDGRGPLPGEREGVFPGRRLADDAEGRGILDEHAQHVPEEAEVARDQNLVALGVDEGHLGSGSVPLDPRGGTPSNVRRRGGAARERDGLW